MPGLASNALSRTSRFSSDSAYLLVTMLLIPKFAKSAKSCSFSGRMATRTRLVWSASQLCTRNCQNLHARSLQDRRFCKTTQRTILMEKTPLRRHLGDPVLPQVSTQRAQHIARSRSRQQLRALHPSSLRAGTRTRATLLSVCPRRRTT
jgi:hypothetical protein